MFLIAFRQGLFSGKDVTEDGTKCVCFGGSLNGGRLKKSFQLNNIKQRI
jgi:hypothetical protein